MELSQVEGTIQILLHQPFGEAVPVAGFFVTGTSASIPAGAGVKAFLDEDLRIATR